MKRKLKYVDVENPIKIDNEEVRNFKFSQIEPLKKSSSFSFIRMIRQNPACKINVMNIAKKGNPVLQKMFEYYNELANEDYGIEDFKILMQNSTSSFLKSKSETINKMIQYSGLANSLSSKEIRKYNMKRPPIISYRKSNHKYEFSEPLPGEYPCMHNDSNSDKSFCLAQKYHGITLKSVRRIKETRFNPKTQTEDIIFKSAPGICLFCERCLYNQIFYICRETGVELMFILNSFRYLVDLPGEYKMEYMLSQQETPKFYGIVHHFPKFRPDMFISVKFKKKVGGKVYVVRGIVEKDECFTK